MNEEDCFIAYRQLEEILHEFNLEWVTEQVAQSIHEGKNIEENQERNRTEEYSAQEKLLLLINAVEQAVVNTLEIETEMSRFLSAQELRPEVRFYPSDERRGDFFVFAPRLLEERLSSARELRDYLNNLRFEVNRSVN
ncbi:hypothetical protein H6F53_00980 [Trichocoleus sp. FACHB-832]|uniref:hypothetical protein n=1 Tax=Trichocoleus sp. FACHB-832 TaxID=2692875 RepID=UPI0016839F31|nr:hypothetical protein [Trichocoleus sp. FACHB-832]MBD1904079.1 hypothetical protein [Trichocoleus sp. FACHB-832]